MFELICQTLETLGFRKQENFLNFADHACFTAGSELELEPATGYCLEVRKVHRHNGTAEDINYYLAINHWNTGWGNDEAKVKLIQSQTEKTTIKKIRELTEKYLELLDTEIV